MIKKIINYFTFPILGSIIVLWGDVFTCQQFASIGFDDQNFLVWDYAKNLNLIPYKDFFYPYGMLFYLKIDSYFWSLVSYLLLIVIFISIYRTLLKIKINTYLTVLLFISYCIFIAIFIDLNAFLRYGIIIPFLYFLSVSISKENFYTKKTFVISGLFLGIIFSFINDLFVYGIIIFMAAFLITYIMFSRKKLLYILQLIIYFLLLFIFGSSLLLLYLYYNGTFIDFIGNYNWLLNVSNFAKVPFPPSLRSTENLFNILVLIFGIFYLIKFRDKNFKTVLVFLFLIMLVLFEQKNIIRSVYQQLTIFSYFLLLIYFNFIYKFLLKVRLNKIFAFSYIMLSLIFFFIFINADRHVEASEKIYFTRNGTCLEGKLGKISQNKLNSYYNLKKILGYEKIFSFPGDPIFYIVFNQKPAPFPSSYDASFKYAQDKQIEYIKKEEVKYVIFNTEIKAIQDGVPDTLRNKKLYEYIQRNFVYFRSIDNFRIYKKKEI